MRTELAHKANAGGDFIVTSSIAKFTVRNVRNSKNAEIFSAFFVWY
jgi:hypothetical protein